MLKILSWNIQQGGGSRVFAISKAIIESQCQMIVLSEFKNNANGEKIKSNLLQAGYTFQATTPSPSDENSVLIASKLSGSTHLYPTADPEYAHNIIAVEFSAFQLMGVYLPHKKKHQLLPFITKQIQESSIPFIIVGDYNTGHNFIDQKGDSFWYQSELKALEATGYLDAFRFLHHAANEYSWFSHQGNGFRYDHTYIHPDLKPIVKACYYLHEWRQNGLSDHSPMVLELG
jgi:exodeoxyribonuclease III